MSWNDRYAEWEAAGRPEHPFRPLVPGATACWTCGWRGRVAWHRANVTLSAAAALAVVDEAKAELERVGRLGADDDSSERDAYVGALEALADAVRAEKTGK